MDMHGSLRTNLGRVRGLGAAGHGSDHFLKQRVSAIAVLLLAPFAGYVLASAVGMDHSRAQAWVGQPVNAGLLFAFLAAAFFHLRLGVQVVVEDYISGKAARMLLLGLNQFLWLGLSLVAALALFLVAAREDRAHTAEIPPPASDRASSDQTGSV